MIIPSWIHELVGTYRFRGFQWCQHPLKAWIGMLTACWEILAMHLTQGTASHYSILSQAKALTPLHCSNESTFSLKQEPCADCSRNTRAIWWMVKWPSNTKIHTNHFMLWNVKYDTCMKFYYMYFCFTCETFCANRKWENVWFEIQWTFREWGGGYGGNWL